jgi:hypothetical protein
MTKAQVWITANEIKELAMFYSKSAARWTICNTIVVQKWDDKTIQIAATDGTKLYVIRRPLDKTEQMDVDEFFVAVNNLPTKGKYLKYLMTLSDDTKEVAFNDGENIYRFPAYEGKYPDIKKTMEPLYNAPYASKFAMFKWENVKALDKVLGPSMFKYPRQAGNVFMWYLKTDQTERFVLECDVRLEGGEDNESTSEVK